MPYEFQKTIGDRMAIAATGNSGSAWDRAILKLRPGYHTGIEMQSFGLTLEECRDLRYMLDSAIRYMERSPCR